MKFITVKLNNSILDGQQSFEDLKSLINDVLRQKCPSDDSGIVEYHVVDTYPDSVVVGQYGEDDYYKLPYTINLDGEVELGDPVKLQSVYKPVLNSMKQKEPLILLNSEVTGSENPIYRMLIQTPNELPAYDMGLDKIKFNEEAIKGGLDGLLGTFVYDETQSNHNKRVNPNAKGKKVAKIVNKGYCPKYGGYADLEVFDSDFDNTMSQALDSYNRGLPVNEGPSTELFAKDGDIYGNNSLEVTKLDYNGLVWIDNPRDTSLGVCSLVNNSILDIKEDENLTDKKGMVSIARDEYDKLKDKAGKYDPLKIAYDKGEAAYNKGKALYDTLKTEEGDLRSQLLPHWQSDALKKEQLVNSLLERVPEAQKAEKKAKYEKLDTFALGEIVNSLPANGTGGPSGIRSPGGNPPAGETEKQFSDPEKQAKWDEYQKLQASNGGRKKLIENPNEKDKNKDKE